MRQDKRRTSAGAHCTRFAIQTEVTKMLWCSYADVCRSMAPGAGPPRVPEVKWCERPLPAPAASRRAGGLCSPSRVHDTEEKERTKRVRERERSVTGLHEGSGGRSYMKAQKNTAVNTAWMQH